MVWKSDSSTISINTRFQRAPSFRNITLTFYNIDFLLGLWTPAWLFWGGRGSKRLRTTGSRAQWSKHYAWMINWRKTHPCLNIQHSLCLWTLCSWRPDVLYTTEHQDLRATTCLPAPQLRSWVSHWLRRVQRSTPPHGCSRTNWTKIQFFSSIRMLIEVSPHVSFPCQVVYSSPHILSELETDKLV